MDCRSCNNCGIVGIDEIAFSNIVKITSLGHTDSNPPQYLCAIEYKDMGPEVQPNGSVRLALVGARRTLTTEDIGELIKANNAIELVGIDRQECVDAFAHKLTNTQKRLADLQFVR